jgi:hypothetical protein
MAATSVTDVFRLDADNSNRQAINLRSERRRGPAASGALRLALTVLRQSIGEPRPMAKYGTSRSCESSRGTGCETVIRAGLSRLWADLRRWHQSA